MLKRIVRGFVCAVLVASVGVIATAEPAIDHFMGSPECGWSCDATAVFVCAMLGIGGGWPGVVCGIAFVA